MKAARFSTVGFIAVLCFGGLVVGQTVPNGSAVSKAGSFPVPVRDEKYRIGYADVVEVHVFRHPELTQRVSVNPNGMIHLFRIPSPIAAVCKTERELANDIAEAYRKDYLRNPEVNVVAVEQKSQAFAVIGAVEKPANYYINRRVRLLELLAFAGGPTKEAGSRLLVARPGSTSNCKMGDTTADAAADLAVMDFKIMDVMRAREDLVMQPGDVVYVLESDVVYVYGNVNEQGQVEMKEPLTLTQALASAKGMKAAANKNSIRILRQKPGSREREELVYSLSDIDKRKVDDPYLEPNDIVAVSEDKVKSILNSIGKSLTTGLPNVFYRVP